ncbi:hypothetical protein POTOM_035394 [Populus tomentosa]|uniref:GAG-pre-integrase domain-containing protein n=1 Tax=Populus tomentosa TaxID=118781 RepID=A0A8X8CE70_POPTO|nr:hypothetical protein POTOM_035394 [Populus tomentosa]
MTSTSSRSLSTSSPLGFGQSTTMELTSSYQQLNHALPVKLDRTNYVLWKSQIDNNVFANGFKDFIDGISVCPEKELSVAIMAKIIGHTTSQSVWNALEKTFSSSSRARIMQLRLELQSTKKGSSSMIDYIMKVKGAANGLATIRELVSKKDQVMNLLGGLGSDYNTVVTAINNRDDKISPIMSLPLITEVVKGDTMAIKDTSFTPNASNYNYRGRGRGGKYTQSGRHNSISSEKPQYDNWYLDSRASHHLTQNAGNLINSTTYTGIVKATVGNGVSCSIYDLHTKKILAQGRLENGLYKFPTLSNEKMAYVGIKDFSVFHSPISRTTHNKMDIWHHRLGHAATDVLAKSHRLPTHLSSSQASKLLELIQMDIWGPVSEKSTSGANNLSNCPVYTSTPIHTDSIPTTVDSISLSETTTFPISPSSPESVPTDPILDSSLALRMITSQTKYVSDLLHRTKMFDTKPVKTPGTVGQNLSKFDGEPMEDAFGYCSVVGALRYLTITRPDIAFAVNKAYQFMQQPTSAHWLSIKRIL